MFISPPIHYNKAQQSNTHRSYHQQLLNARSSAVEEKERSARI
jgi:hypothetical protein